jgi:CRP-like cAMP-binding protein
VTDQDGVTRTPRLTQTDLAAAAGTTRETLNKWLGFFAERGIIRWESGRVIILQPEGLRRRIY